MDRSSTNRYLDRLKSIRRTTGAQAGSAPAGGSRRLRRLSLLVVFAILACMALAVAGTLARRNAALSTAYNLNGTQASQDPRVPVAQPESGESILANGYANPADAGKGTAPGVTGATAESPGAPNAQQASYQNWDRMIIRTATLQLQVKDVSASLDRVRSLAGAQGGYIASSESHVEGEYTVATVTLQVPAAQFDDAMSELRKLGIKAIGENVSSADVTEEFTDLQSQLRNLQATEQRIQALMVKAERIEDVLTLDRELRQIQSEIERIMGRTNYLSKRAEMSSITVSLYPEVAPIDTVVKTEEGWNPGKVASEAWNASLEMLAQVADVAITLAVFMWWAVPLLLLALWFTLRPRKTAQPGGNPTPDAA